MRRVLPLMLLALLALPVAASASYDQESVLFDTEDVINGTDAGAAAAIGKARALGITRLRIVMNWLRVVPNPERLQIPVLNPITRIGFDPRNPAAYPHFGWRSYDRAIRLARAAGLDVYVDINGFAPRWATPGNRGGRLDTIWRIDPAAYRAFAHAVGARYSGSYQAEDGSGPLPRVSMWSFYNEPNQGGWLAPQFLRNDSLGTYLPTSPQLYREMVYAGYEGLKATGHGNDEILIGELAPSGRERRGIQAPMRPLLFLREFFCLDGRLRPYTGALAKAHGCLGFRPVPGTAFAHHPYSLTTPPDRRGANPDDVPLASLGRLARVLDAAAKAGRVRRGMPIWNTEYGWQTRPDPYIGISPELHADYLMKAELISWRNQRLKSVSQYLLRDEPRRTASESGGNPRKAWGSWQSGVYFHSGKPKPALLAFQLPIQAVRKPSSFSIWGMVRPGAGTFRRAVLQHRPLGGKRYSVVGAPFTVTGRGYFVKKTRLRRGNWRFVWLNAPGAPKPSRSVKVR